MKYVVKSRDNQKEQKICERLTEISNAAKTDIIRGMEMFEAGYKIGYMNTSRRYEPMD